MIIVKEKKQTPSKYQVNIYDTLIYTDKNIVVKASAGSGKTTTIIECSKLIPQDKCSLFVAFNKSIVEELGKRLPNHVQYSTIHSIGMKALMSHFRTSFRINEFKLFPFIEEVIKTKPEGWKTKDDPEGSIKQVTDNKAVMAYKFALRDAIDLCRMTLTEMKVEELFKMCVFYNIDLIVDEMQDIIAVMKKLEIYNRSFTKKHNYLDYTDMITIPLTNWKIKLPQFDYLFIDEGQDLNRAQQLFTERLLAPKGRTILVGDPNQSLYSFAGADINSFERFQARPNTVTLPLSISYRCPKLIVELARQVYDDIEQCDTQQDGEIRYGSIDEMRSGDMVLCRNNRPLVFLYFELLEKGLAPIIIGKDIQVGLEALISKVLKKDVYEGMEIVKERLEVVREELKARGVKNIKEHPKYEALNDKIKTLDIIADRYEYMYEVKEAIVEMFTEKENCIKLMTIHKSKGLEADRVFHIERFDGNKLLPSPYAVQPWEQVQEKNLQFVMITRAKKSLIFIQNINSK